MRQTFRAPKPHSQYGAIVVEAALVLTFLVLFVTFPTVFYANYFYNYSAAQKAVHDAALYLSTAPKLEMAAQGPDGDPAALTVARKIIAQEMAGLSPPSLDVICGYRQASGAIVSKTCSSTNNQSSNQALAQLTVSMDMSYINPLTGSDSGLWISPYAVVPYVGN